MANFKLITPQIFIQNKLWRPHVFLRYAKTYLSYTVFLQQVFRLQFIITGIPKCGTTWFARIMASYPDTYVTFESSPQSIEGLMRSLLLNNPDFDLANQNTQISLKRFKQYIVKRALLSNKKILGYKVPEVLPEALKATFPDVRVLFLFRDGRDFIVSDAFHNLRKGRIQGDPESETFWDAAIERRAPYWANMVTEILPRFREIYRGNLFELRYEDLLEPGKGQEITRQAFLFWGLDPAYADEAWKENSFNRLSGGRRPGQEDRDSFFRKGISGDWRNYFSSDNLESFLKIAGDGLNALGYEI